MALTERAGRVRPLLAGAVLAGIAALLATSGASAAAPGQPVVPTIASVTARLDALATETTALAEKYDAAQAGVRVAQLRADVAAQAAGQAAAEYRTARTLLAPLVTANYENWSLTHGGSLLISDKAQRDLTAVDTLRLVSAHRADVVARVAAAEAKAKTAQQAAGSLLADAQSRRDALDKQRGKIITETLTFKNLLATLTIAQQASLPADTAAVQWAAQCAQDHATAPTSVGSCGDLSGYVNPFAGGSWKAERTDQGVDWGANKPEPVVAIGDGVVTYSNSQQNDWPGGAFIVYGLTTGNHAGLFIYVAENLSNLVPAGTVVKAGQQIAVAIPGGPDTEWGFAAAPGTGPNVATPYNGAPDGTQTSGGQAFARFLIELGAKPLQPPGPGPDIP